MRTELRPDWVLLDARTGLSEPAGILLAGIAHLHVLFATASPQSWQGLRLVLEHLGADRVRAGEPQAECVLVQAMVPEDTTVAAAVKTAFADRARDEFSELYYAPDPQDPDEDRFWYIRDAEDTDAPHVPVALSYQPRLAHFSKLEDVADLLAGSEEYRQLAVRISDRFADGGGA